jgi:hypothetical protein
MLQQKVAPSIARSPSLLHLQRQIMGPRQNRHFPSHQRRLRLPQPKLPLLPLVKKNRRTNPRVKPQQLQQQTQQRDLLSISYLQPRHYQRTPLILQRNRQSHFHQALITAYHKHLQQGPAWRSLSQQQAFLARNPQPHQHLNSHSLLSEHQSSQYHPRAAMFLNPRQLLQPPSHPKSQVLPQHL